MSEPDFADELRAPFRQMEADRSRQLESMAADVIRQQDAAARWPGLRDLVIKEVLPRLKTWTQEVAEVIQPAQVKQLKREKRRLGRMSGITWWHPRAIYLRLRLSFYTLAILALVLFWTALVIGFVVGFFWALFKVMDVVQGGLG